MSFLEHTRREDWLVTIVTHDISVMDMEIYADMFTSEEWDAISSYQKLSEETIYKFRGELNWDLIPRYQELSEKFIIKTLDWIELRELGSHNYLSTNFIKHHGFTQYSNLYLLTHCLWKKDDADLFISMMKENLKGGVQTVTRNGRVIHEITEDDNMIKFLDNISISNYNPKQKRLPFNFPHKKFSQSLSDKYMDRMIENMEIIKSKYDIWH